MDYSEFRKKHSQTLDAEAKRRNAWIAQLSTHANSIQPGDLFVFSTSKRKPDSDLNEVFHWMSVFSCDAEPNLWWCVPVDLNPDIGLADVLIPAGPARGEMVARCAQGVWVSDAFCADQLKVGTTGPESVELVRDMKVALDTGSLPKSPDREEVEDCYDYQDWIRQVESAAETVRAWAGPTRVIKISDRNELHSWEETLTNQFGSPEVTFAAEGGLFAEIRRMANADSSFGAGFALIPYNAPGNLLAVASDVGITLIFVPSNDTDLPPKLFQQLADESVTQLSWNANPHGISSCHARGDADGASFKFHLQSETGPTIIIESP